MYVPYHSIPSFYNYISIIRYPQKSQKTDWQGLYQYPRLICAQYALTVRLSEAVAKVISPLWLDMTSLCAWWHHLQHWVFVGWCHHRSS